VRALASVPHRLGEERATVPTVVLPITSRGLVVTDRVCWAILGVAMAVAAALILYFNRGTTFYVDQIIFLYQTPELGVGDVLDPHNGHLIVTTRLAFKAILETFGAEYVAFRVLGVGSVLLSAGFFYALVKRRIGALPALAPAFVLLFLGSAWQHVVGPIGFTPIFSIALGLAALLALERGDRVGDIAACALLIESVASYTSGLPFIVGAAISVLAFRDRWKRAWIFLVPLALYTVWWLWSQSQAGSSEGQTELQNALLIPTWEVESLAAALAAVTGLGFDFSGGSPPSIDLSAGRVLAVVAVIALALRIRRGNVPVAVWASLGIVVTWWALGSLAFGVGRAPDSVRYLYLGALGVMLVGVAAASGARFSRVGLVVLFGACALSLATNIVLLRDSGNYLRTVAATTRTELAMLELSRDRVDPGFNPAQPFGVESPLSITGTSASTYFGVADRYGSLAMPISELEASSENLRAHADRLLATALGLRLEGDPSPAPAQGCERVRSPAAGAPIGFALPAGGATLRAEGAGTVPVTLGRFAASPTVEAGSLTSGESATLRIPPDDSPRPWHATVTGGNSVTVCPLS
jgi:hypothetical protein